MSFSEFIQIVSSWILFAFCLILLAGSLFLSFRLRFVQMRLFPALFRMLFVSLFKQKRERNSHTIVPHRALFTAMSTTLGIGTLAGPVIAIHLGGPGALLGFLFTAFFGSAATFAEVSLSLSFPQNGESGVIEGGPMQYLKVLLSPRWARWYAVTCLMLMTAWSGAQANQLSSLLNSPLLGAYRIAPLISGSLLSCFVLWILVGGIQRVGSFSSRIVPIMFVLYVGGALWILFSNKERLGECLALVFRSAIQPQAMGSGVLVGGMMSTLRWGIFKGTQATEAGIGTQTIPHSMAETQDPRSQGTLAMLSTYTAGFVAFLSGFVTLVTNTYQNPKLPLGISMVMASFQEYFSFFGVILLVVCTLLFGFGTVLGNSYNGSHCFFYLTRRNKSFVYLAITAVMIFVGSLSEVKFFWTAIDTVLAAMALPHLYALVLCAYRERSLFLSEDDMLRKTAKIIYK